MFDLQRYTLRQAAVTSAVVGIGSGIAQTVSGISNTKKAKDALNKFQRQELSNPFESIEISTLKSDQQTDANLTNFATSVEALRRGCPRTILGGLPRLNEQSIQLQNLISQDLERQDTERQRFIARGEERIQGITEQREERALQGLGQQLQTGRQDTFGGIFNTASAALSFGSALRTSGSATPTSPISETSPIDTSAFNTSDFTFASQGDIDASIFDDTNSLIG